MDAPLLAPAVRQDVPGAFHAAHGYVPLGWGQWRRWSRADCEIIREDIATLGEALRIAKRLGFGRHVDEISRLRARIAGKLRRSVAAGHNDKLSDSAKETI